MTFKVIRSLYCSHNTTFCLVIRKPKFVLTRKHAEIDNGNDVIPCARQDFSPPEMDISKTRVIQVSALICSEGNKDEKKSRACWCCCVAGVKTPPQVTLCRALSLAVVYCCHPCQSQNFSLYRIWTPQHVQIFSLLDIFQASAIHWQVSWIVSLNSSHTAIKRWFASAKERPICLWSGAYVNHRQKLSQVENQGDNHIVWTWHQI